MVAQAQPMASPSSPSSFSSRRVLLVSDAGDVHGLSLAIFAKYLAKAYSLPIEVRTATIGTLAEALADAEKYATVVITDIPITPQTAEAIKTAATKTRVIVIDHHPQTRKAIGDQSYGIFGNAEVRALRTTYRMAIELLDIPYEVFDVQIDLPLPYAISTILAAGAYTDRDAEGLNEFLNDEFNFKNNLTDIMEVADGMEYMLRVEGSIDIDFAAENQLGFIVLAMKKAPKWREYVKKSAEEFMKKAAVLAETDEVIVIDATEGSPGLLKTLEAVMELSGKKAAGAIVVGQNPRTKKYSVSLMAVAHWLYGDAKILDKVEEEVKGVAKYTFRFGGGKGLGAVFLEADSKEEFENKLDEVLNKVREVVTDAVYELQ